MDVEAFNGSYHRASSPYPGVLLLELNRPPVNAFSDEMWQELKLIVERVSASPDVRCIVLSSGLDKYFTAGLDLTSQSVLGGPSKLDPARQALLLRDHILEFQAAITSLSLCRQPIIAAIHGAAIGLAVDIASACDIRLASSDAYFSIAEVNVGLAADVGTLQRFPKIVGNDSKARELAFTAGRFDAAEAKEMGFISRVIQGGRKEVTDAALAIARTISEKSPIAVMSTKHLMNHSRDHSVQEGLEYTAAWNMSMLQSSDTTTAMKAALAKEKPIFQPVSGAARKAKL